jgi:hypothetical protein
MNHSTSIYDRTGYGIWNDTGHIHHHNNKRTSGNSIEQKIYQLPLPIQPSTNASKLKEKETPVDRNPWEKDKLELSISSPLVKQCQTLIDVNSTLRLHTLDRQKTLLKSGMGKMKDSSIMLNDIKLYEPYIGARVDPPTPPCSPCVPV